MFCLICDREFAQRAHNQFLCQDPECVRLNRNMLNDKYRNEKRPLIIIDCKICGKGFEKFGTSKTCSDDCKKKNIENIKLKYYVEKVMPKLAYKPSPTEEEKETRLKEYNSKYNNAPERKEFMKKYRRQPENREKERLAGNSYRDRNPDKVKNGHLKRNYKITIEKYNEMLLSQNMCCAICLQEEKSLDNRKNKSRDLAVDHCHETGKVRGLLCWQCNTSLGKFKDSIEILQRAIDYLNKSRESSLTNPSIHDTIVDQEN